MNRSDVKAFLDAVAAVPDAIDGHFHVFRRPQVPSQGARYTPPYAASLADWEGGAPLAGRPKRGVLVQTSFAGTDNSELLETLRSRPQTLRGIAVIDPPTATADVLAAMDADGVRGIRLNLVGATPQALDDAALPPRLVDELAALGWNVELHTDAGLLPRVLERIDLRLAVVLDHFGKPAGAAADDATFRAVAQRLAAGSAPVHVKLSAPYRLAGVDPRALAARWRDTVGVRRLLWGSDWPCTNHESQADPGRLLAALDDWIADPLERRQILLDNPLALYWR